MDGDLSGVYCWAWDKIYIKANGRVPCYCDHGEPYTVVHKDMGSVDFVHDVLNSPEMRQMRVSSIIERRPFIKNCGRCSLFEKIHQRVSWHDDDLLGRVKKASETLEDVANRRGWPLGSIDRVSTMHVEPSFICNLKCPGCIQGWEVAAGSTEPTPHLLPLKWFKRMVESLAANGITVDTFSFAGRGEPTLNRKLPKMLSFLQRKFPDSCSDMETNAGFKFKKEYLLLRELRTSIDGATQESYEKYRRGGDFEKTLSFMREAVACKRRSNSPCVITWKYILFDVTDDTELLNKAQQIASDIGIDTLIFIITSQGSLTDDLVNPSRKFKTTEDVDKYIAENKIFHNTVSLSV